MRLFAKGSVAALALAIVTAAALPLATTPGLAATEVIIITIEPADEATCLEAVEELRSAAKGVAGTALAAAHADEGEDACKAGEFADAEDAISDGYRWLRKKQGKGL